MSTRNLIVPILLFFGIIIILKIFITDILSPLPFALVLSPFWLISGFFSSKHLDKVMGVEIFSYMFYFVYIITIFLIIFFNKNWIDDYNLLIKYTYPGLGMTLLLMSIILIMYSGSKSLQARNFITFIYLFIVLLAILNISPFNMLKWFWLFAPYIFFRSLLLGNNAIFECGNIFRLPLIIYTASSILFLSFILVFNEAERNNEKILWISVGTSIIFSMYCKASLDNIRNLRRKMQQRNDTILNHHKKLNEDYYVDKKITETETSLRELLDPNKFRENLRHDYVLEPAIEEFSYLNKFNPKLLLFSIPLCIIVFSTLGYAYAIFSPYLIFKSFDFTIYFLHILRDFFPDILIELIKILIGFIFLIILGISFRVIVSFSTKPIIWLYKRMNSINSLSVQINTILSFLSFLVTFFWQLAKVFEIQLRDLTVNFSGDFDDYFFLGLILASIFIWIYGSIAIALGLTIVRKNVD